MVWFCDSCLGVVSSPACARVEWISLFAKEPGGRDLRLVHDLTDFSQRREVCQFDARQEYVRDKGKVNGAPLADFLGPDGLMRLLSLMVIDGLPRNEVLEMIKRLHVPGYEEARYLLRSSVTDQGLAVVSKSYYPTQSEISAALKSEAGRSKKACTEA